MKKFITSIILFISASIILSSCGSSGSLTKRHYRKGYYVSNKHKPFAPKIKDDKQVVENKMAVIEPVTEEHVYAKPVINSEILASAPSKNYAENNAIKKSTSNYFNLNKTREFKRIIVPGILKKEMFHSKKLFKSSGDNDDKDGLSLFWIVILIILILWAVGFLEFALGAFIHLLLVIALVLLILWLLRII